MLIPSSIAGQAARCAGGPNVEPLALPQSVRSGLDIIQQREAKSRFQRWIRNPLLSFAEHRLPLFICALLVPEYVLAWAIRQYLEARKIARNNKGRLDTSG